MAYSTDLASKVADLLKHRPGYQMKHMFGGVCFLLYGNMACGILGDELIVRVGPARYVECLEMDAVRDFDITGRTMKGWIMVTPDGLETDEEIETWVERGVDFALTLPAK